MDAAKPHKLSRSHRRRKLKRQLLKQQQLKDGTASGSSPSAGKRVQDEETNSNHLVYDKSWNSSHDATLHIQAYEADIVRGPQAKAAARSLEIYPPPGEGLIRWNNNEKAASIPGFPDDGDVFITIPALNSQEHEIWVDRYDARLLLDTLPPSTLSSHPSQTHTKLPQSPSGWSDLPSDSEDTFFFSPEEASDYHRSKRRRLLDASREARVNARMIEDGDVIRINGNSHNEEKKDGWGGSDEEPDEAQITLMSRTAQQFLASANPAQLEMRILANYGSDRRFAFLRGRWATRWQSIREDERKKKEQKDQKENGLGLLVGYGSESDTDNDENERGGDDGVKEPDPEEDGNSQVQALNSTSDPISEANSNVVTNTVEAAKAARRARAREWAEKRRLGTLSAG